LGILNLSQIVKMMLLKEFCQFKLFFVGVITFEWRGLEVDWAEPLETPENEGYIMPQCLIFEKCVTC